MNDTKPWYLSRTVWASIVTIVIACCGLSAAPFAADCLLNQE